MGLVKSEAPKELPRDSIERPLPVKHFDGPSTQRFWWAIRLAFWRAIRHVFWRAIRHASWRTIRHVFWRAIRLVFWRAIRLGKTSAL